MTIAFLGKNKTNKNCISVYHTKCIDPWLTKNKRRCPICKRRVIPGTDPDDSDSDTSDEDEAPGPSERTPLLGSGGTAGNNNNRNSMFDNSGRYIVFYYGAFNKFYL